MALHVYVKQLEKMVGPYDPLALRWTFTFTRVLLHTGLRVRALALLALVIDGGCPCWARTTRRRAGRSG
ncbi:hypothetical protein [Pseudonocardia adelaidensis]|uniref:Uncharacterized protein n=1 Tax=Pseudonocardia adelaidensis TaxID=648754 RepID=A0ABP9NGC6_9PSEU